MTKEQERQLAKEVEQYEKENPNGNMEFEEVPEGKYEVELAAMELGESKKGDTMFKARFKVVAGKFKGSSIFMNQLFNEPFKIAIVNNLIRSFGYDHDDIFFKSCRQYETMLKEILAELKKETFELDYSTNSQGFGKYKISLID